METNYRILILMPLIFLLASAALAFSPVTTYAQVTTPREQTLVIGGAYWEPPKKYNPFNYGGAVSGVVGLIYEPLYLWIPIKPENERWMPWLAAELPQWVSTTEVVVKLRPEVKWWDGRSITAEDVKFTFYDVPRKVTTVAWAGVSNYLTEVQVIDDKTVKFVFNPETVNYADFHYLLYETPILPKHFYETYVNTYGDQLTDLAAWPVVAPDKDPTKLVGSGMYKVIYAADDHFILERVDDWWGREVFGKLPAPKYIKGVVVYSNQVAANMLGSGELDWSCFYIPGGPTMVQRGYTISYFKDYPFYLSANVAFLFVNTEKPPFNDSKFRKAMYFAINVDKIISSAFEGVVIPSNPVGLLPYWEKYLATDLLNQYGYKYDPEKAKQILDQAGYVDRDGDGWRDMPDGRPLSIKIIVPYGWTDWMFAIISIADDLKAIGIYAEATFPDFGVYISMIDAGEYDAAINNFGSFAAPSPYSLYYWAYAATPGIWTGNHGRYSNAQLIELIEQLGRTPLLPEYESQVNSILRDIQKILLDEMPALPLWYNGYWFLASTRYWTGWPSEDNPYGVPTIWNGQWQHGGLLALLNLKSTAPPTPISTPITPIEIPWVTIAAVVIAIVVIGALVALFIRRKK